MKQQHTIRRRQAAVATLCLLGALLCSGAAAAQVSSYGDKETGQNTGDQLPKVLKGVQVSQHLNQQLPMDVDVRG